MSPLIARMDDQRAVTCLIKLLAALRDLPCSLRPRLGVAELLADRKAPHDYRLAKAYGVLSRRGASPAVNRSQRVSVIARMAWGRPSRRTRRAYKPAQARFIAMIRQDLCISGTRGQISIRCRRHSKSLMPGSHER